MFYSICRIHLHLTTSPSDKASKYNNQLRTVFWLSIINRQMCQMKFYSLTLVDASRRIWRISIFPGYAKTEFNLYSIHGLLCSSWRTVKWWLSEFHHGKKENTEGKKDYNIILHHLSSPSCLRSSPYMQVPEISMHLTRTRAQNRNMNSAFCGKWLMLSQFDLGFKIKVVLDWIKRHGYWQ